MCIRALAFAVLVAISFPATAEDPPESLAPEYFDACMAYRVKRAPITLDEIRELNRKATAIRRSKLGREYDTKERREAAAAKVDDQIQECWSLFDLATNMDHPFLSIMPHETPHNGLGHIAWVATIKQVVSDDSALIEINGDDYMIRMNTKGLTDDTMVRMLGRGTFWRNGTYKYTTVTGASRTVPLISKVSDNWLFEHWETYRQRRPDEVAKVAKKMEAMARKAKSMRK